MSDTIDTDELEMTLLKEDEHRRAVEKRLLAVVACRVSKKFMAALKDEMDDGGVYPNRIVRLRDIKSRTRHRGAGTHKCRNNDDPQGWNHYFVQHIGGYEDSYWGNIWFPMGAGRYLFCGYST